VGDYIFIPSGLILLLNNSKAATIVAVFAIPIPLISRISFIVNSMLKLSMTLIKLRVVPAKQCRSEKSNYESL